MPVATTTVPDAPRSSRRISLFLATTALAVGALTGLPAAVSAATPAAPGWTLDSFPTPSTFSASDNSQCLSALAQGSGLCDSYQVTASEAGAAPTDGSPVTLTDALPAGLTVQKISFFWEGPGADAAFGHGSHFDLGSYNCDTTAVQCTFPGALGPGIALQPDDKLVMSIDVTVNDPSAAGTLQNAATVSGGGAPDVSASSQNALGGSPPPFGFAGFSSYLAGPDGRPDTQAGDHPYELTTRIDLPNKIASPTPQGEGPDDFAVEDPRDVVVDLPLGVLGSALAAPQCSFSQLVSQNGGGCPADTAVGHIRSDPQGPSAVDSGLFNMVPEHGVAAEFGYIDGLQGVHVLYARVVPTPQGYVLRTTAPDIPQVILTDFVVTLFGNPAAKDLSTNTPITFLTNSSHCDGEPLVTHAYMDSWPHPGRLNADATPDLSDPNWKTASSSSPPVIGCNKLQFQPTLSVQPDSTSADSASGLDVEIKVPQSTNPDTLATPPLKRAVVTLPQGVSVNPSAADGLGACSQAQIDLASASEPTCPDASKIGTVALQTPLVPGTLTGSIYLARQFDNPFHSLLAGYIVVDDPTTGVVIKIPGNLTPDPTTGQITGVFDNNPQFPFSDLKLHFKGGDRGVLATPESCGTFTTTSALTPWSAPDSGPDSTPSDPFNINSGCVSGFAPSFTAGTQNPQAGAFSPFVLSFSRSDTDQNLQGLSVKLPPGMLAKLAGVQLCSDQALASISDQPGTGAAQAANPSCPAGSQVGTVQTGAGVGSSPLFLGGKAYLTGPYKGAPYGLAVVVPALAGPFDLGTVVVRQALFVDPTTAQVTAVSDPFPTILDGIPLRLRRVDVSLDRPGFTVNPTSCAPMAITGALTSVGGLNAPLSSRFQVGGCQELAFAPKLKLVLSGKGQTTDGKHPGVTATLTMPATGDANIHSAKVALPLSLALDPANSQHVCSYDVALAVHGGDVPCPANTQVGTATVITPLLDQPLTAKVYLVQGIRFNKQGQRIRTLPTLLIGLRGQIALDLRASSSVDSGNHLVTTFSTVPDAPVTSFTLNITGGKSGILVVTHHQNVCKGTQNASTVFGAQSGKTSTQTVKLGTPCGKPAHLTVLSHKASGHLLLLRVRTSERGRLTVTGQGLRQFSRVLSAGVHRIRIGLVKGASAGKVMNIKVALQPANAMGATHTFQMRE
jgi:hypothetical protein